MAKASLKYNRVKAQILERIERMQAHDRIPARNVLMSEYDVTRTTVDRAISELIADGHLYARDGSGTYVAPEFKAVRPTTRPDGGTWAIVIPDVVQSTFSQISRAVEDYCHEHGIALVVCNSDNLIEKQNEYVYRMIERQVDGMIITPAIRGVDDPEPFRQLSRRHIPFVFVNQKVEGIEVPAVISNRFYGVYVETKHLISLGHTRIGFVSRPLSHAIMLNYQGYVSAMEEAELPLNEHLIRTDISHDDERPGYAAAREILATGTRPDALVCFNDGIAKHVCAAVEDAGLEIGTDVAVVGYGNAAFSEMLPVPLTTVEFRAYDSGRKAAEFLHKLELGEPITPHPVSILKPELIVRASCGAARADIAK